MLRAFNVRIDSGFSIRIGKITMAYKRYKCFGCNGQVWTMNGGAPAQITLRDITIENNHELQGFGDMMATFVDLYTVKFEMIRYVDT